MGHILWPIVHGQYKMGNKDVLESVKNHSRLAPKEWISHPFLEIIDYSSL